MVALSIHADSLGLVFYMFVASSLACASFGLQLFPDAFTINSGGGESGDEDTVEFKTVLSAFWFLLYQFPTRGNLKGALRGAEPKGDKWLPRIFFDSAFYIWIGILLSTTVTALLVDALGQRRTDQVKRLDAQKHGCFVCGVRREAYDDLGLEAKFCNFDEHAKLEHNPWMCTSVVV
jgi:hypothetical protein